MVMALIRILMERFIKANEKMINKMDKVKRNGQMVLDTKASIMMGKKKVMGILYGGMEVILLDSQFI